MSWGRCTRLHVVLAPISICVHDLIILFHYVKYHQDLRLNFFQNSCNGRRIWLVNSCIHKLWVALQRFPNRCVLGTLSRMAHYCCLPGQLCDLCLQFWPNGKIIRIYRMKRIMKILINTHTLYIVGNRKNYQNMQDLWEYMRILLRHTLNLTAAYMECQK